MKRQESATFIYAILFCFLVGGIIFFPNEAYSSAFEGLKLWFNVVCPALLPFFICVEILIGLGIVSFLGSIFKPLMQPIFHVPGEAAFAFFMSISSGYPIGSKITAELRKNNVCTQVEGQRMLSLCSTSGPLFIIGAVATGILGNPKLGFFLAISHYFSALTIGFLMRFYGPTSENTYIKQKSSPLKDMLNYRNKDGRSIGILLGDAVKNSVNLLLVIGGFIVLFSVIACILKISGLLTLLSNAAVHLLNCLPFIHLTTDKVSAIIIGMLEVTNGINTSATLSISIFDKALIASFLIGFGGLSVNAQVLSLMTETDLKFGLYLFLKVIQGFIAVLYTYLLLGFSAYTSVFNFYAPFEKNRLIYLDHFNVFGVLMHSTLNLLFCLGFIIVLTVFTNKKVAVNRKTT